MACVCVCIYVYLNVCLFVHVCVCVCVNVCVVKTKLLCIHLLDVWKKQTFGTVLVQYSYIGHEQWKNTMLY